MLSIPDAIILCGGSGSRLKSITGDKPKPLVSVAGRPFLELLLQQLRRYGFRRVILASGYQSAAIRKHFGERALGLELIHSVEPLPLGTGGALAHASTLIQSEVALIMNGDSYTDVDLCKCVAAHRETKAAVTLVVVPPDGRGDCGVVSADESGVVRGFSEKAIASRSQYINAGVYVISTTVLLQIPAGGKLSLEQQLLPEWLGQGKNIRSYITSSPCVDIGTPERYSQAQEALANAESSSKCRVVVVSRLVSSPRKKSL